MDKKIIINIKENDKGVEEYRLEFEPEMTEYEVSSYLADVSKIYMSKLIRG